MFTGIIECLGEVREVTKDKTNIHYKVSSPISNQLKIDQSIAHNGVCLTVVEQKDDWHVVTAIQETLNRSQLGDWAVGTEVNLERCTKIGDRLDGHIVQGHVDTVGTCTNSEDLDGSIKFHFEYSAAQHVTVEKGSITVNGVSLTVVDSDDQSFSVAIIPYTLEHTTFKNIVQGSQVNLEFDIVGKYVARLMTNR